MRRHLVNDKSIKSNLSQKPNAIKIQSNTSCQDWINPIATTCLHAVRVNIGYSKTRLKILSKVQ